MVTTQTSDALSILYLFALRRKLNSRLAIFQYKIIHNILYTNSLLYKMKKINSPDCPFCINTDHTILQLFFNCPLASSFWSEFINWYHLCCKEKPTLTKNESVYGVLHNFTSCLTLNLLNHLILLGKHFLYKSALNEARYQFADFIALVKVKIDLERYIATQSNKICSFTKKWNHFLD